MSTTPTNGGSAFPIHYIEKNPGEAPTIISEGGMSLRDYFAAKASDADILEVQSDQRGWTRQQARFIHADRMIAARNQTTK